MKWSSEFGQRIAAYLHNNGNNISDACKQFGISRKTFHLWIKEHPDFAEMVEDASESVLDMIQTSVITQAISGNITAAIFYLKTKGAHRGFIEKKEVSGQFSFSRDATSTLGEQEAELITKIFKETVNEGDE